MTVIMDLVPTHTATLALTVPVPLESGGWAWGELGRFPGELAREFCYSLADAVSLVSTYARVVAGLIKPGEAERFTITLRERVTGTIMRRAEFVWNIYARSYIPSGEAWCGWKTAMRAYWTTTGRLFTSQRFDARATLMWTPRIIVPGAMVPAA